MKGTFKRKVEKDYSLCGLIWEWKKLAFVDKAENV